MLSLLFAHRFIRKMKTKLQTASIRYGIADPLPVMEHFYTLQGEGYWTGTPAYFIRLAGCDVGCHWCDVKESWTPKEEQYFPIRDIVDMAGESGAERVVITGGEPSIYDLSELTRQLHEAGFKVHLETAGPHPLKGDFDWICFSPKKFLPALPEYYQHAHELKIIVFNQHDFQWAEEHANQCGPDVVKYLQVEWDRRDRFTDEIIEYIKENPHWKLSLQTHKFTGIP